MNPESNKRMMIELMITRSMILPDDVSDTPFFFVLRKENHLFSPRRIIIMHVQLRSDVSMPDDERVISVRSGDYTDGKKVGFIKWWMNWKRRYGKNGWTGPEICFNRCRTDSTPMFKRHHDECTYFAGGRCSFYPKPEPKPLPDRIEFITDISIVGLCLIIGICIMFI